MDNASRQAMAWLHTWAGLLCGGLAMVIFWTGTLCVFDQELDRWMMPETRLSQPAQPPSLDAIRDVARQDVQGQSAWFIMMPTTRTPMVRVGYFADGAFTTLRYDPTTLARLPDAQTDGASGFLVPLHDSLHIEMFDLGHWLVGLTGMALLTLIVSGILTHRNAIRDLFVFRGKGPAARSMRDLHTISGLLGTPFYALIIVSGLSIVIGLYFPAAASLVFGTDQAAFSRQETGFYSRPPAKTAGPSASLDAMAAEAHRLWKTDSPGFIRVWYPGDAHSVVEMAPTDIHQVSLVTDLLYFDATTGALLHQFQASPLVGVQRFLSGLHFVHFDHAPLRWTIFALGMVGCVMIATGFLFWGLARQKRHASLSPDGQPTAARLVTTLTIGFCPGLVAATAGYLLINRLLPGWDHQAFYGLWAASFMVGWVRAGTAWKDLCGLGAVLMVACPLANALTTGDGLLDPGPQTSAAVMGVDAVLLLGAALCAWAAWHLQCRAPRTPEKT